MTPPSEEILPASKAEVIFLRLTAGNSKQETLLVVMADVAVRASWKGLTEAVKSYTLSIIYATFISLFLNLPA